jgi:hypothetical protein
MKPTRSSDEDGDDGKFHSLLVGSWMSQNTYVWIKLMPELNNIIMVDFMNDIVAT